jgi:hypothetical protein
LTRVTLGPARSRHARGIIDAVRFAVALSVALTACSFRPGAAPGVDALDSDAARDGVAVDADDRTCASVTGLLAGQCLRPTGALVLGGPTFDTTTDSRCDATIAATCVLSAQTIEVPAAVTVTGSRPLVLFASQTIHVAGTLDVSSRHGATPGAGANSSRCNSPATLPTASNLGAGGGAGGSFGDVGGDGGAGNANLGGGQPAMLGGTAALAATTVALRGGCPGQQGADGTGVNDGGVRGDGGGATYLFAAGSIAIDGAVFASGAGGQGGLDYGGGGGGGSGGLIGLESPTIAVTGTVAANGGAGGGGGSVLAPLQGGIGDDGATTTFNGVAQGGTPGFYGGTGGHGSSVASLAATSVAADAGGGGGGGGVGVIWVRGALTGTQISPTARVN